MARNVARGLGTGVGGALAAALVLMLIAGALAGCGEEAQPIVYTAADDGRTVTAAVGDVISIRLKENPSTGYTWEFELSAGLEQRSDSLIEPRSSPGIVGAAGVREITFAVTAAGTQSVKGVYARPWEDSSTGERTFSLLIEAE